ncbi:hypothetical protein [Thermomonospora umbrina]|uniref:Uncharacterized protein n=1 Tax=Thermomonospora umbrina TaxID=111806 RepID=A0A3D9SX06_9ACTN|nr:hypothetical protein [Thermomonospora umbrina]REF00493.1 hypothetical protein DFJ69_6037 [Thermomonospora umbrina]
MTRRTTGVAWKCESRHEVDVIRDAVTRYERVLIEQGTDPGNYAAANEQGAGFGWTTIEQAARDMHNGSVTYMSVRIAEAFRAALSHRADQYEDDYAATAGELATRMGHCIDNARPGT